MRFDLLAPCLGLIDESLHDLRMFARVDGEHSAVQESAVLFSDCLILVL